MISPKSMLINTVSWIFGIAVFAAGIVNTFWGNDPGLGVGMVILSFVYFPPATAFLKAKTGIGIPAIAKIVLGLILVWISLGVGELPAKIQLMLMDF